MDFGVLEQEADANTTHIAARRAGTDFMKEAHLITALFTQWKAQSRRRYSTPLKTPSER
jgi:hypothetical protein